MTPDPKLVEVVARAIARSDGWDIGSNHDGKDWSRVPTSEYRAFHQRAAAALAAISVIGEWWVAPWEATPQMLGADITGLSPALPVWQVIYIGMRDAYLKDTGT